MSRCLFYFKRKTCLPKLRMFM
uniref:Uncharacterized protein n=1 Tax=Anguilla anguilla TaxID=7936 RepID=A0A0E9W6G9_ANGAN